MIGVLLVCMAAAVVASDVSAVASDDMVRLVNGSGAIRIIYRNRSTVALHNLKLTLEAEAEVKSGIRPATIPRCLPADRCVFELTVERVERTPERRFGASLLLSADGQPELHRRPLHIDAGPGAASRERGWMPAGSIQVGTRSETARVLVLTLLAALPVFGLLGLGWWFKRRARGRPPRAG